MQLLKHLRLRLCCRRLLLRCRRRNRLQVVCAVVPVHHTSHVTRLKFEARVPHHASFVANFVTNQESDGHSRRLLLLLLCASFHLPCTATGHHCTSQHMSHVTSSCAAPAIWQRETAPCDMTTCGTFLATALIRSFFSFVRFVFIKLHAFVHNIRHFHLFVDCV